MCGIAGLWRLSGADPSDGKRIHRMSVSLRHRGPNDFGYLVADTVHGQAAAGQDLTASFVPDLLLASRRLSILDLSPAGRQPIGNETGDVFVVFNGAIHNYIELRQELEGFGHVFRSHTDTEVIVHAYEQWGPDCANRFNGMWAYAIWDRQRRRLVCSRDRFGIKPLVIARHGGAFYFASEAKAILAAGVPAVPNPNFIRQHQSYSYFVPGEETAFSDILQVPPAHSLVVTPSGEHLTRYWNYTDQSETYDYRNPTACFRDLFDDAVRLRLRSDVPIAVLLSGGVDSSAVTARTAEHQEAGRFEAFTAAFPGYAKDERDLAELMAASRGVPLNVVLYDTGGLWADLNAVSWALDMAPSIGQILARWHLLKSASQKARIVLEGQGADEMLGGYPSRYLKPYAQSELASLRPWNLYPRLWRMVAAHRERKKPRPGQAAITRQNQQKFSAQSLLAPDFAVSSQADNGSSAGPAPPLPTALHEKLWRDHSFDWLPHILHFGDGISMAHSVESRLPFLDHRLVEFTFGLPFDQLVRGAETKYILRRSMARELPAEIVNRREKIGFETPTEAWMRDQLHSQVLPILRSDRLRNRGIFNQETLDECVKRVDGKQGGGRLLFLCCGLEAWFRQCIDGDGLADLPDAPDSLAAEPTAGHETRVPGEIKTDATAI